MDIQSILQQQSDPAYGDFISKLLPTVNRETIYGVRIPLLRRLTAVLWKAGEAAIFLAQLPHDSYEENLLHVLLIGYMHPQEALEAADCFLPYLDNWAVCDSLRPKIPPAALPLLDAYIRRWLASDKEYTQRFGLEMRMLHFLEDHFLPAYLEEAVGKPDDPYYVYMMQAWFYATALCSQWETTLPYMKPGRLYEKLRRKSIQKALESRLPSPVQKEQLRLLRERNG